MDQPVKQPRGDIYATLNRYKQRGDKKPMFVGHVTRPGETAQLPLTLWARHYTDPKTGEQKKRFFGTAGSIASNASAMDHIDALMTAPIAADEIEFASIKLKPGQVVFFPNQFKAEAPDKNRPDFSGGVLLDDGTPLFRACIWLKAIEDSGDPYLSGATSFPLPGKSEAEMQDAIAHEPVADRAEANVALAAGIVERKSRSRGGRGELALTRTRRQHFHG